jgi:DNA-binding protein H-NS
MDLKILSLEELKQLQNDVAVTIFNFEKRKKADAIAELEALAKSKGFSLNDLFGGDKGAIKKGPVAARYADPNNSDNTWTGRGRKPKWLVEQLANGKSLEDFSLK